MTAIKIRRATLDDAPFVLEMSEIAGHGFLPHYFRQSLPPDQDLHAYMLGVVCKPQGKMSYTLCWIAELDGTPVGLVNLDAIPDPAPPVDTDLPLMFQPLAELEASVPGATVIEFLATTPAARGKGVGRALLQKACDESGPKGAALVVSDQNLSARALYDAFGFKEVARRAIVTQGWHTPSTEWVLMTKS
jgi:ribosomal protein S18 acetylase RimI-like enzyme